MGTPRKTSMTRDEFAILLNEKLAEIGEVILKERESLSPITVIPVVGMTLASYLAKLAVAGGLIEEDIDTFVDGAVDIMRKHMKQEIRIYLQAVKSVLDQSENVDGTGDTEHSKYNS